LLIPLFYLWKFKTGLLWVTVIGIARMIVQLFFIECYHLVASLCKSLVVRDGKDGTSLPHSFPEESEYKVGTIDISYTSLAIGLLLLLIPLFYLWKFKTGLFGNHDTLPLSSGDLIHTFIVQFLFQPQFIETGK